MRVGITAKDIIDTKGSHEICDYADAIFEALYDTKTQERVAKEVFIETLPEPLQVAVLLNDFLTADTLEEAIQHITIEETDPGRALFYQEKIVWALQQIGKADIAGLVKDAIRQYEEEKKLTQPITSALSAIDPHDSVLYDPFATYIRNHVDTIVTKEYTEKIEAIMHGPAKNTKEYTAKIKKYPWLRM